MRALVLIYLTLIAAAATATPPDTTFVEVQPGVKLEVLDWGGSGHDVLLLSGLGNTAHVYDEFAPILARHARVRAVTRRGFGASTHAVNGYDPRSLARDLRVVCDSLGIARPVLVGHSLAGSEMAWFAWQWPGRAKAMVFLDAAYDHARIGELDELAPRPESLSPAATDLVSDAAMRAWIRRTRGFNTPLSEIHALFRFGADGRLLDSLGSATASGLIRQALVTPPYHRVKAPTLTIYTKPDLVSRFPAYRQYDVENLARAKARVSLDRAWMSTQVAAFQQAVPHAEIVVHDGANHHLFLTEGAGVAMGVGAFVAGLD